MGPEFGGVVASYYARYRRGYPPAAIDLLVDAFGLTAQDVVMDLGCGTGQLSLPLAEHGYGSPDEFPEVAVLRSRR